MSRRRRRESGGCFGTAARFVTALLMLVACGMVFGFGYLIVGTDETITAPAFIDDLVARFDTTEPTPAPTVAAVAEVPTATNTNTPSPIRATFTPLPAQPTFTPVILRETRAPTESPTPRPTLPSRTPTFTPTATATNTPTATPTGPTPTTAPTRSQFPFTKTDTSPFYLKNFANNNGCDWLGVAGEVLDLSRNPVAANSFRVHVWGEGIDQLVFTGTAPIYSDSGWEVRLGDSPTVREYNVQLESVNGTAVSQVYRIQTRASCDDNLVRLDFVQNN